MGKLVFTEDGKTIIRNFSAIRTYNAKGRMSPRRKFNGLVILECGTSERPLEFVASQSQNRRGEFALTGLNLLMFGVGAVVATYANVIF